MTEQTKAYIESIANGRVPAEGSDERKAYVEEFKNRDYTWAIQTFQHIKAEVAKESATV